MRLMGNAILCCLFACCCTGSLKACTGVEPSPESKWARGIADDFWGAIFNQEEDQAMALLTPELAKALTTYERIGGVNGEMKEAIPPPYLTRLAGRFGPKTSVSFDSQDVAPDRTEVVLKGSLSGKDRDGNTISAGFTMRVARDIKWGKWGIRFLRIIDRAKEKGPER